MYDKKDKRRLYWIIDQYLHFRIDDLTFCNEFHDAFVNEIDSSIFTEKEFSVFLSLSQVSQRFSHFEEDFKLWAGFVNKEQLRQAVIKSQKQLEI